MSILGPAVERIFFGRRRRILARAIAPLLPEGGRILDVGCGDGRIDREVALLRPDVGIEGVDVMVRSDAAIAVRLFDGSTLPFPDRSFDAVLFIDVLHHTEDPLVLLREAMRVSRKCIVLKDHTRDGSLADRTLRIMDWLGNAHHDIPLPYNFWSEAEWRHAFHELGLETATWNAELGQYPWWAGWLVERRLHMVTKLNRPSLTSQASPG